MKLYAETEIDEAFRNKSLNLTQILTDKYTQSVLQKIQRTEYNPPKRLTHKLQQRYKQKLQDLDRENKNITSRTSSGLL